MRIHFKSIFLLGWVLWAPGLFALDPSDLAPVRVDCRTPENGRLIHLFTSPGDSAYWGPDICREGRDFLDFGVYFPDSSATFDLLGIDTLGRVYLVRGQGLTMSGTTIVFDGGSQVGPGLAEFPLLELKIENRGQKAVQFLFLAPRDSNLWGFDTLDALSALETGDTIHLLIPLSDKGVPLEYLAKTADGMETQGTLDLSGNDQARTMTLRL